MPGERVRPITPGGRTRGAVRDVLRLTIAAGDAPRAVDGHRDCGLPRHVHLPHSWHDAVAPWLRARLDRVVSTGRRSRPITRARAVADLLAGRRVGSCRTRSSAGALAPAFNYGVAERERDPRCLSGCVIEAVLAGALEWPPELPLRGIYRPSRRSRFLNLTRQRIPVLPVLSARGRPRSYAG